MANQDQNTANHDYKSRRLSQVGKAILVNVIPALKTLKAGQTLLIEDPSPARIDQVRSHLYTYFSETSQKRYFRTVRESAKTLRIICQDLTPPLGLIFDYSLVEAFVIDNLLRCENLDEATTIARSALTAGEITDEDFLLILAEWEKKVGSRSDSDSDSKEASIEPLNGTIKEVKNEKETN